MFVLWFPFLLVSIIAILCHLYKRSQYHKSSYYQETHTPYSHLIFNKGTRGEYSVATILAPLQFQSARILHNLYIPIQNGNTTEIDTVLITRSGIFVIEVKNLSGWIFGDATRKYWCQSLPTSRGSRKHSFYNPIWQNGTHIRALRQLFTQNIPFYSIIVFSDRCTLKQISIKDARANVVYLRELRFLIERIQSIEGVQLSDAEVCEIYTKLYPYAHVDDETKARHLFHISQKHR